METKERKDLIKKLQDIVDSLIKKQTSAMDRCNDLTRKLLYPIDSKIILVMNREDYSEISVAWHHLMPSLPDDVWIIKDFETPYGKVSYLIVDDKVTEMHGYTLNG